MSKVLLLIISILVFSETVYSQEDKKANTSIKRISEYSWNPSDADTSPRLMRFYTLGELIRQHYDDQNFESLLGLIDEYLRLADVYKNNWNYGNATHDGNRILGLVSYHQGDIDGAASYLVDAGESTGSPQLDSFGPNFDLADLLLRKGKTEEVKAYLRGVGKFWERDEGLVDEWIVAIEHGKRPRLHRQARYLNF